MHQSGLVNQLPVTRDLAAVHPFGGDDFNCDLLVTLSSQVGQFIEEHAELHPHTLIIGQQARQDGVIDEVYAYHLVHGVQVKWPHLSRPFCGLNKLISLEFRESS